MTFAVQNVYTASDTRARRNCRAQADGLFLACTLICFVTSVDTKARAARASRATTTHAHNFAHFAPFFTARNKPGAHPPNTPTPTITDLRARSAAVSNEFMPVCVCVF